MHVSRYKPIPNKPYGFVPVEVKHHANLLTYFHFIKQAMPQRVCASFKSPKLTGAGLRSVFGSVISMAPRPYCPVYTSDVSSRCRLTRDRGRDNL